MAPETALRPQLAGVALGVVSIGQNLGMLMGPPLIANTAVGGNWVYGTYPVIAAGTAALVAVLLINYHRLKSGDRESRP